MDTSTPTPGRGLLLQGFVLALIAVAAAFAQSRMELLFVPWYVPILMTVGLLFAVAALVKGRSIGRWVGFFFLFVLAGGSWAMIGLARLPAYAGPLVEGKAFPAFTVVRADGTPFTQRDLEGDADNILVFFRGRW